MKKLPCLLLLLAAFLCGCAQKSPGDIAATTLPVYQFTTRLTDGDVAYVIENYTKILKEYVSLCF